jgi:Fe-S cluster assembly protein SufD
MNSEKQYIDLYGEARQMIFDHAAPVLNAVRDQAFEDFKVQGIPTKKVERYKYTDMQQLFEPDYGLNLNRSTSGQPYDASVATCPTSAHRCIS